MILINCSIASATEEINFPNYYPLKKSGEVYKFYRSDETTKELFLYGFDAEGLMLLAQINTSYLGLLDLQSEYIEQIESLQEETGLLETELQLENKSIAEYKLLYETTEIENQDLKTRLDYQTKEFQKTERRKKIKGIFVSTGVGVVGLSVGLILGAFLL